jgi:hypothetical protein
MFRRVGLCWFKRSGRRDWDEDVVFDEWGNVAKVDVRVW